MHPSPIAETVSPFLPSCRVSMGSRDAIPKRKPDPGTRRAASTYPFARFHLFCAGLPWTSRPVRRSFSGPLADCGSRRNLPHAASGESRVPRRAPIQSANCTAAAETESRSPFRTRSWRPSQSVHRPPRPTAPIPGDESLRSPHVACGRTAVAGPHPSTVVRAAVPHCAVTSHSTPLIAIPESLECRACFHLRPSRLRQRNREAGTNPESGPRLSRRSAQARMRKPPVYDSHPPPSAR